MHMRRYLPLLFAFAIGTLPAVAAAHTQLIHSSPRDGAHLASAPSEIVLTFADEVGEDSIFDVYPAGGGAAVGHGTLDLTVGKRNVVRGDVHITAEGVYTVRYSVIALDGDEVTGSITFAVGDAGAPNTAAASPTVPGITLIGVLLLLVAGSLALRRSLGG